MRLIKSLFWLACTLAVCGGALFLLVTAWWIVIPIVVIASIITEIVAKKRGTSNLKSNRR